MLDFKNYELK